MAFSKHPTVQAFVRRVMSLSPIFVGLGILSVVVLSASIYADFPKSARVVFPLKYLRWSITIFVIFFLGSLFGAAWSHFHRQGTREFLAALLHPLKERSYYPLLLVAVLVLLIAVALSSVYTIASSNQSATGQPPLTLVSRFVYVVNTNPGGIFVLFTGFATLFALALTLQGIWDLRRSITSFPDLMDRLCKMLTSASSNDRMRMICYTPALGNLALPEYYYGRFFDKLTARSDQKPRAEIICLGPNELSDWHNRFVGRWTLRGQIDLPMAQKATENAAEIVSLLGANGVKFLPYQFMPGCYFFFTRSQAIVVAPLFLQYPQGAPKMTAQTAPPVDMIGFETNDKGIIHTLEQMYKRYKELPSTVIGEASAIVDARLFQSDALEQTWATIGKMLERVDSEMTVAKQGEYQSVLGKEDVKIEMVLRLLLKET